MGTAHQRRTIPMPHPLRRLAGGGGGNGRGPSGADPIRVESRCANRSGNNSSNLSALRKLRSLLLQGKHIKIHLRSDIPVQVDGEPWIQSPCEVVILKSALKVRTHFQFNSIGYNTSSSMLILCKPKNKTLLFAESLSTMSNV